MIQRIACDIDGVLANFTEGLAVVANRLWPGKVPLKYSPPDWNYSDIFTDADFDEIWKIIGETTNFWLGLPDYRDGIQAMQGFMNWNPTVDVHFITSRTETQGSSPMVQTAQWLRIRDLWPRNGHSSVIVVDQPSQKFRVMKALGIKFSLDDKPETVSDCLNVKGHIAFLLDRSWNRDAQAVPRVDSVAEYLSFVKLAQVQKTDTVSIEVS